MGLWKRRLAKRGGDSDIEGSLPALPVLKVNVAWARLGAYTNSSLFYRGKTGMLRCLKYSVSYGVVTVYAFGFGGAGNSVVAENIRVFSTSGAGMEGSIDWESKTILQCYPEVFGDDG